MNENKTYIATDLINAGFSSPAHNGTQQKIDLNEELVKNKTSTFFIRVQGHSMIDAHIQNNDILVVDKSLTPKSGQIVIALIDGEFTVKRLKLEGENIFLKPENPDFKAIKITDTMDFKIWGVVTYTIHSCT